MKIDDQRTVDPLRVEVGIQIETADLHLAFAAQSDPDEDLFYAVFSEAWEDAPMSEKLMLLSRIARLAEDGPATNLVLTPGTPEPKE